MCQTDVIKQHKTRNIHRQSKSRQSFWFHVDFNMIKDSLRKLMPVNTFTVFNTCSGTHPLVHRVSMCCEIWQGLRQRHFYIDQWCLGMLGNFSVTALGYIAIDCLSSLQIWQGHSHTAWWLNFKLVVQILQTPYQVGWPPGQLLTGQLVIKLLLFPWAGHLTSSCSCGIVWAISVL